MKILFLLLLSTVLINCKTLDFIQYGIEGRDVNQIALFGSEQVDFGSLDRVELKGFKISDFNHPKVKQYVKIYQTSSKKNLISILDRGDKYIPTIKKIFKEKGIPEDFCYLPIIESGFNPHAKSYKYAVGIWQFIYTTGKYYGLENSYWHDDRSDPLKATIAAAYHLKFLYKRFNDWLLVLAAYNAGSGKISRAIKMYKTKNFWEMAKGSYIKRETKNYVPKFIAATLIAKNPIQYDLPIFEGNTSKLSIFRLEDATDLSLLAKCADIKLKDFRNLNPALKRWATPPSTSFDINIPEEKMELFVKNFSAIDESQRVTYRSYMVKLGDNLTTIAGRFEVPIRPIAEINKLKSLNQVRAGEKMFIPIQGLKKAKDADKHLIAQKKKEKYSYTFFHEVSNTDTLYNIAQKYNINNMIDIYLWNNLKSHKSIYPGMLLMLKKK